jgi:hypothetical protein
MPVPRQLSKQEVIPRLETSIHSISHKSNSNLLKIANSSGNRTSKNKVIYNQLKVELETETSKYSIKSPLKGKASVKKKELALRQNIYEEIKNNKIGIDSIMSTILI